MDKIKKTVTLLTALFCLQVCLFSQSVNISLNNVPVKKAITALQDKSGYNFVFENNDLNTGKTVSVNASDLKSAISQILAGQDVSYKINGKNIIVFKNSAKPVQETDKSVAGQDLVTVSGKVVDTKGAPIIQASVLKKGTTQGSVADFDGNFKFTVDKNAVLEVSCLGYVSQTIALNGRANLTIVLREDLQSIEETVVVGYATQKKANLTGAVSTVDVSRDINNRTANNLSDLLAGAAAGLTSIASNEGSRPGANSSTLKIRGTGTTNNANPLVVVDGFISSIDNVNPADVENISVLKDAASSSIYGSRAANGVILVTTKKGKAGQAKVSLNATYALQKVGHTMDIVSSYADYMEYINEGFSNQSQGTKFTLDKIKEWRDHESDNSEAARLKWPNTDWTKEYFRVAHVQNHTVSVQGGTDKVRYFISGNFYKNPGIIKWTDYKKFSARANVEADVNRFLTIGLNVSGYRSEQDPNSDAAGTEGDAITWGAAMGSPGIVLMSPDGRLGSYNNTQDNVGQQNANAFRRMNFYVHDNSTVTNEMLPRIFARVTPFKDLVIEGSYTYQFNNQDMDLILQDADLWNFYTDPPTLTRRGTVRNYVNNYVYQVEYRQMDATAKYNHEFGKLKFGALVGTSQEKYNYRYSRAAGYDQPTGLNVIDATTTLRLSKGNNYEWAMRSVFGRINLNYEDKYLFEANLRADASSRFSPENRWGYFPSFSAGWVISNESFFHSNDYLNFLKLRASYGSLGNNAVGNYAWQSTYSARNYVLGNTTTVSGMSQNTLANRNIEWEKTTVTNIGLDFTGLKSRLSGSFEAYDKTTDGILISLPAALANGTVGIPTQNAAKIQNRGVEVNLSWNQSIGEFNYNVSGNFACNKNEVKDFGNRSVGTYTIEQGQPMYYLYVMDVDRLVRNQSDLDYVQSLVDKDPNYFSTFRRPELGDYLYKDSNADGELNYNDRIKASNGNQPQVTYGLSLGANWKGFDFSAIFNGVGGWKDFCHNVIWRSYVQFGATLAKEFADDHWTPENTDAKYPRYLTNTDGRNDVISTAWVYKRDYLRLKTLQFGYSLPKDITRKFYVDRLRVFVSFDNLFTLTEWPGFDPEIGQGNANQNYPTTKMTTFGINITL